MLSKTVTIKPTEAKHSISNQDSRSIYIVLNMRFGCTIPAGFRKKIFSKLSKFKYEIEWHWRDQSRDLISISSGAGSVWATGIDGPAGAGRPLVESSAGLRGK
jgi:hypothetical protein